ncbi:MAG: hypothetical protein ACSHX5_10795 [Phycisphaerales bacterium]
MSHKKKSMYLPSKVQAPKKAMMMKQVKITVKMGRFLGGGAVMARL